MALDTSAGINVYIKRESSTGVAAGSSGSTRMRINDSPGLEYKRALIKSGEKRNDGYKSMARLGAAAVDGSYNHEVTVGGATDIMLEAIARSTWTAASVAITCDGGATYTSLAATANTITLAGSGSFITAGVRVGDIVRLGATTANDNINCRVVSLTATVLTLSGSPLAVQSADTNATLTILKKLKAATTPTRYSHTIEQYREDTDLAELFLGCRLVGLKLSYKPGSPVMITSTWMGMDRTIMTTGTSPYFSSPTETTGLGMICEDSQVWFNGAVAAYITGFDLDFKIAAKGEAVLGSFVSPDVFDNDCEITGTLTGIRTSLANATAFGAETEFDIGILLTAPASAVPYDTLSVFLPRVKIAALSAPAGGGDGPVIETMAIEVGPKVAATGYDGTPFVICSSAA